jgi:hypothetical protein
LVPSRIILNAIADLIAADTGTLGAVAAMHVHLVASAFTPSPDLDIASLTLATFTGGAPKNAGTGGQQVFIDLASGYVTVQILEPAGGWTWECTADPASPETIFGIILTDNTDADLYASMLLDSTVTVSAAGEGLTVPRLIFRFPPTSPF